MAANVEVKDECKYKVQGIWIHQSDGLYFTSQRTDIENPNIREIIYKEEKIPGRPPEKTDHLIVVSYVVDLMPGRFYYDALVDDTVADVLKSLSKGSDEENLFKRCPYCPATGKVLGPTELIRNIPTTNGDHLFQLIKYL